MKRTVEQEETNTKKTKGQKYKVIAIKDEYLAPGDNFLFGKLKHFNTKTEFKNWMVDNSKSEHPVGITMATKEQWNNFPLRIFNAGKNFIKIHKNQHLADAVAVPDQEFPTVMEFSKDFDKMDIIKTIIYLNNQPEVQENETTVEK
uniref:Uncharacterized protein n=1 Tax=Panagrolaimus sp. JU765 TaxID=591449 RepID=A0AC34QMF8_9BILA